MSGTDTKLGTPSNPDLLINGQEVFDRLWATGAISMTSGSIRLAYFTARKSEDVAQLKVFTGSTPAAATPTLVRLGLYSVASNGDLTLVASTPNDTTLLAGATTAYSKAISGSYTILRGQRYALGLLVVSGTTVPSILATSVLNSVLSGQAPRRSGTVTGQTDLPASISTGIIQNTVNVIYGEIVP